MIEEREDDWIIVGDEAFTPAEWDAIPHGTNSGYTYYGCRCPSCRAWQSAYDHKRRKEHSHDPR